MCFIGLRVVGKSGSVPNSAKFLGATEGNFGISQLPLVTHWYSGAGSITNEGSLDFFIHNDEIRSGSGRS